MTTQERFDELVAKELLGADAEELLWLAKVVESRAMAMVHRADRLQAKAEVLKREGLELQRRADQAIRVQQARRETATDPGSL